MATYKGFSTVGYADYGGSGGNTFSKTQGVIVGQRTITQRPAAVGSNTFLLTDADIVERNILNHMFTRRGERVMMPSFGSSIPDLLFEPLDENTMETVRAEIMQIVDYDPRVELINLTLTPDTSTHLLQIQLELFYKELDLSAITFVQLTFDQ